MRVRLSLRRGIVSSWLEHITVARANGQLRPIDSNFDRTALTRLRGFSWIIAETVLPAELFGHLLKSDTQIFEVSIVEPGSGHPREVVQIMIGALVLIATIP